jgi:hypothetical protein
MREQAYHPTRKSNVCSGSTTWHFKDGSLATGARPYGISAGEAGSIYALRARDPRKPLDLQISYRGGPEGLWVIQARGWQWRCSGGLAVVDVMNWINRCDT